MQNWIKLTVVAILIGAVYLTHKHFVDKEVNIVRQEYVLQQKELERKALEKQGEILIDAIRLEQIKDEEIRNIASAAESLRSRVSKRPARSDAPNLPTEVASSCTGRELFREDGEFLIGEAARAQRILEERNFWYTQYEQVRKKLEQSQPNPNN